MRRTIKIGILSILEISGMIVGEMVSAAIVPYGRSSRTKDYVSKEITELLLKHLPRLDDELAPKSLKNVIYKLKKDGLIDSITTNKGEEIFINSKGRKFLAQRKKNIMPSREYPQEEISKIDKSLKIIIFDIPEKDRRKRDWLREVIKNLGFNQLQQSVWTGNKPIPKSFIQDLENMKLLKFVEIFSIDKKGTIQKDAFLPLYNLK